MEQVDIIIIGGGVAGLSVAIKAHEEGCESIVIIEKEGKLGGILQQNIHSGFKLKMLKDDLTGPEYADKLIKKVQEYEIPFLLNTEVLDFTDQKEVKITSETGVAMMKGKAIIVATGGKIVEKESLGSQKGIYSAFHAQKLINVSGGFQGKEIVIFGSEDIGLLMARHLTFLGVKVAAVIEPTTLAKGSNKNIVHCLHDYHIPLLLNQTITKVFGQWKVEGAEIAEVTEQGELLEGTEQVIQCDTIILSSSLVPHSSFVDSDFETNISGIFTCGNALHIHNVVESVSAESFEVAKSAVDYLKKPTRQKNLIPIEVGEGIDYVIPQFLNLENLEKEIFLQYKLNDIFRYQVVTIYADEEKVFKRRYKIVTPHHIEQLKLTDKVLEVAKTAKKLTIQVERRRG